MTMQEALKAEIKTNSYWTEEGQLKHTVTR